MSKYAFFFSFFFFPKNRLSAHCFLYTGPLSQDVIFNLWCVCRLHSFFVFFFYSKGFEILFVNEDGGKNPILCLPARRLPRSPWCHLSSLGLPLAALGRPVNLRLKGPNPLGRAALSSRRGKRVLAAGGQAQQSHVTASQRPVGRRAPSPDLGPPPPWPACVPVGRPDPRAPPPWRCLAETRARRASQVSCREAGPSWLRPHLSRAPLSPPSG